MTIPGFRSQNGDIRQQVLGFNTPLVIRDFTGCIVNHGVAGAIKPGYSFFVKIVKRRVRPVQQEVALYIFDHVLNLTRALGVCRTAEDDPERAALDITVKDLRHPVITDVLIIQEHGILVIDEFLGHPVEEVKSLLMARDGTFTCERLILEPDELIPAIT